MRATYPPVYRPDLLRQDVAARLQRTYEWTLAASAVVPKVAEHIVPPLTVAAQLYEAEQYQAALRQLSDAVMMAHQARMAYPALPGL